MRLGYEITAFLRHTLLYMFPTLSASRVKACPSLSAPPPIPPCPPLHHLQSITVYFY